MTLPLMIILLLVIVGVVALLVVFLTTGNAPANLGGQQGVNNNLRALVMAQRERSSFEGQVAGDSGSQSNLALAAAADSELTRKQSTSTSKMTLEKKLRYAKWPITPIQFRTIQLVFTIGTFIPAYLYATVFIQILVLVLSPLMVSSVLDRFLKKRFEQFDEDYPVLLLSYVSLLKTGMETISGLGAAAKGLDHGSLVRAEVDLLLERLRLGLTEEQAISAFGEDIAHPELELFVQSLILSRRVGGQLSSTLERLAKQVRKRQQFRKQAVAAVGMEASSIYMIAAIMGMLLCYLAWSSPELVFPAFKHPLGRKVLEAGLAMIVFGFYWSKQVTKLKI